MKVVFERLTDTYSGCETCGTSWAEGFRVTVDGAEVTCLEPIAHCTGGQTFSPEDAITQLLREWGYEVEFN